MRAYAAILSARFRTLLQYRAAAMAGLACQMFWGAIRMMILLAFYENGAGDSVLPREHMISYVWFGQAFLCLIPFRGDTDIAQMIRNGNVGYELLRPIDLYSLWYCRAIALRVAPAILRAVPMLTIATLVGWVHWGSPAGIAGGAVVLVMAVLLSSAITMLMTLSMFWTIAGDGITRMISITLFLFGGMIVPLPLFPQWLQPVVQFLPFRGVGDVTYRCMSGHMTPGEMPAVIIHQLLWTVALIALGKCILARASRRLVVQGG